MKKNIVFYLLVSFVFSAGTFSSLFANDYGTEDEFVKNLFPVRTEEINDNCILIIESDIQKAEVYINGVYQGKTKLTVKNLMPGEYFVEIKKEDYVSPKYFLTVRKGYSLTYQIEKEKLEID